MGRMHGEHRDLFGARQLGAKLHGKPVAAQQPQPIRQALVAVCCPCALRPYPHHHSLLERQAAVRFWNRLSSVKLEVPNE